MPSSGILHILIFIQLVNTAGLAIFILLLWSDLVQQVEPNIISI